MRSSSGVSQQERTAPVQKKPLTLPEIEDAYPDVRGQEISALRALRGDAIRAYDFARSDAIYRYIGLRQTGTSDYRLAQARQWLSDSLDQIVGNYFLNLVALNALRDERELQVRAEVDQLLHQMKRRHRRALLPIFHKRHIAMWRAEQESGAVILLRQRSIKQAFANRVAEAMELKANADDLHRVEVNQRKNEVDREYDQHIDRVTARQREDLEQLDTRLRVMLGEVAKRREAEFTEQTNRVIIALKYHLKKAVKDSVFYLEAPARRNEITIDLTGFLHKRIDEQNLKSWLVALE
jgi:hypothetical protein